MCGNSHADVSKSSFYPPRKLTSISLFSKDGRAFLFIQEIEINEKKYTFSK